MHYLTAKREIDKLRRERLESLVKALYAHGQWLEARRTAMVFRNEMHDVASPLDEVRMFQALYFPQLAGEVVAVQQAQLPLLEFIHKQHILRLTLKDDDAWIKALDMEPYYTAYERYFSATTAIEAKCRALLTSKSEG